MVIDVNFKLKCIIEDLLDVVFFICYYGLSVLELEGVLFYFRIVEGMDVLVWVDK